MMHIILLSNGLIVDGVIYTHTEDPSYVFQIGLLGTGALWFSPSVRKFRAVRLTFFDINLDDSCMVFSEEQSVWCLLKMVKIMCSVSCTLPVYEVQYFDRAGFPTNEKTMSTRLPITIKKGISLC